MLQSAVRLEMRASIWKWNRRRDGYRRKLKVLSVTIVWAVIGIAALVFLSHGHGIDDRRILISVSSAISGLPNSVSDRMGCHSGETRPT